MILHNKITSPNNATLQLYITQKFLMELGWMLFLNTKLKKLTQIFNYLLSYEIEETEFISGFSCSLCHHILCLHHNTQTLFQGLVLNLISQRDF